MKERSKRILEYGNRCGNCHAKLNPDEKYCSICGTERGKGEFAPYTNNMYCLYGPPITHYYKCKKCGHIWGILSLGGVRESKYCPMCGTKHIINTETEYGEGFELDELEATILDEE